MKSVYWILGIGLVVIGTPVLMVVYYMGVYGYSTEDCVKVMLSPSAIQTRFAYKYTDANFKKVKAGMTGKEVHELIYAPLEKGDLNGVYIWHYSFGNEGGKFFHQRVVVLRKDDKGMPRVVDKIYRFHLDSTKDPSFNDY
jgi:hypothetical protein